MTSREFSESGDSVSEVVFVDSSILYNLLDIPHKNSHRVEVLEEFARLQQSHATLIFPVTAVVETGNTIGRLDGAACRDRAEKFAALLRHALDGTVPWAVSGVSWGVEFLRLLLDGGAHGMGLVDFATVGIGGGDASILLEIEQYRRRIPGATPVRLWTRDVQLAAYS